MQGEARSGLSYFLDYRTGRKLHTELLLKLFSLPVRGLHVLCCRLGFCRFCRLSLEDAEPQWLSHETWPSKLNEGVRPNLDAICVFSNTARPFLILKEAQNGANKLARKQCRNFTSAVRNEIYNRKSTISTTNRIYHFSLFTKIDNGWITRQNEVGCPFTGGQLKTPSLTKANDVFGILQMKC